MTVNSMVIIVILEEMIEIRGLIAIHLIKWVFKTTIEHKMRHCLVEIWNIKKRVVDQTKSIKRWEIKRQWIEGNSNTKRNLAGANKLHTRLIQIEMLVIKINTNTVKNLKMPKIILLIKIRHHNHNNHRKKMKKKNLKKMY